MVKVAMECTLVVEDMVMQDLVLDWLPEDMLIVMAVAGYVLFNIMYMK